MNRLLSALLLVLLAAATASAQGAIEGVVLDAETEAPVVGATVRVDGTGRGVAADLDGILIGPHIE